MDGFWIQKHIGEEFGLLDGIFLVYVSYISFSIIIKHILSFSIIKPFRICVVEEISRWFLIFGREEDPNNHSTASYNSDS